MGICNSTKDKITIKDTFSETPKTKRTLVENEKDIVVDNDLIVKSKNGSPFDDYVEKAELGEGSYGKVYKVMHKTNGLIRAMKLINKDPKNNQNEQEILNEIEILKRIDHPNIVKIFEFYNTKKAYYIVTEFCEGGELFEEITENAPFSEYIAAKFMYQIFTAVNYCHKNNIMHRDLKPENILIEKKNGKSEIIKIIDFGTAKISGNKEKEKTVIGSAYYIAPEVLTGNYNYMCDLWSCGVIMFILLTGEPPFKGENDDDDDLTFEKIKIGKYDMSKVNHVSIEGKDLIVKLLQKNPDKRLKASSALQHGWFKKNDIRSEFSENDVKKIMESLENIRNYNPEQKLQQVVIAYLVHNIPNLQSIKDAYRIFLTYDENLDGKITKDEMLKVFKNNLKIESQAAREVDSIFNKLDNDGNGYIEYEEFVRASINKNILTTEENLKFAFNFFDKDGSGEITIDELKSVFCIGKDSAVSEALLMKIIEKIDVDGNKEISFEEFKIMMKKIIN